MYTQREPVDYKTYPKGARLMMIKSNALAYDNFFEGQKASLLDYFDFSKPVAVIAIVHQMERKMKGPDVICVAIPNMKFRMNANLCYRDYHRWHGTEWLLPDTTMLNYDDEEFQEEVYGDVYGAQWLPYDIFIPFIGKNQEGKYVLNKLDV